MCENAYRARKRQEVEGGTFPQAHVVLVYRQWTQCIQTELMAQDKQKPEEKYFICLALQTKRSPDGNKCLQFCLEQSFVRICSGQHCRYFASMLVSSNSTDNCTECVGKVQIFMRIIPPEQYGRGLGWCERRRSEVVRNVKLTPAFKHLIKQTSVYNEGGGGGGGVISELHTV